MNAWRNATVLKPEHSLAWNNMIILLDNTGAERSGDEGVPVGAVMRGFQFCGLTKGQRQTHGLLGARKPVPPPQANGT